MLYIDLLRHGYTHEKAVQRIRIQDETIIRVYNSCNQFLHMTMNVADETPSDDMIYRVEITKNKIYVVCLGLDSVDAVGAGVYDSVDTLPDWIREKTTVLSLFQCGGVMPIVPHVGRRISEHIFWVFKQ